MSYLICYDISDEKRLRKVFKAIRSYGDHLQYSVFECRLTPMDLTRCRRDGAGSQRCHSEERSDEESAF
jgi:CRISPR-associated protein Cas2